MLEVGFYLLLVLVLFLLAYGFKRALVTAGYSPNEAKRFMRNYWIIAIIWAAYLPLIVATGVFKKMGMFPALPLFMILPVFALIAWFHFSERFRAIIQAYPKPFTVYFQTFRIAVEVLLLGVYLKGLGPIETTFEGRNFDIFAGLTAPVVGWLAFSKKLIGDKALLIWNILCLLLLVNIVFIFNSMGVRPQIWGYSENPIKPEFVAAPYLYVASVFMPAAVFMHIMSIKKLIMKKAS